MGNFFKVLFVCLSALWAMSCNSFSGDYERGNIDGGYRIYEAVYPQKILDKDPAYMAFRLNTLLATAAEAGDPDITVDNVEVKVQKDRFGGKNKTVFLKDHFFAGNMLWEASPGVWKIEFERTDVGYMDYVREGVITINTKGKLLGDLADGESWVVDASEYVLYGSTLVYKCKFGYYYIEGMPGPDVPDGGEGEEVPQTRTWEVTGSFTGTLDHYETRDADWDFQYAVTQSAGGGQFYEDVVRSEYEVSGEADGYPIRVDGMTNYKAKNLKYRISCGYFWIYGGAEVVTIERGYLNADVYPSNTVKYLWIVGEDRCTPTVSIGYNDYVGSLNLTPLDPKDQI